MLKTYDVGSIPIRIGQDIIRRGGRRVSTLLPYIGVGDLRDIKIFEEEVVKSFLDKLAAGIEIPNYPQLRDMNEMFLELIRGVEKEEEAYRTSSRVMAKPYAVIPEVEVLRRNASRIAEAAGLDKFKVKICVTGPYTLSSPFKHRDSSLLGELGDAISEIVSNTLFKAKRGEAALLFIDEPVFGFLNDPLIDYGSEGRAALLEGWEEICRAATSKGAEAGIHLHNTSDGLFWDVEHLGIVESHVDDMMYTSETTLRKIRETGKRLKASVCKTDFDTLIAERLRVEATALNLGEVWSDIRSGRLDPAIFLETASLMYSRLRALIKRFGVENVPYAGPECGLRSFPTYDCAMECLRRVSEAARRLNAELS
jgi:5-methyltetrahydropteroyltriglutamate--homocysteine methyltransferase